MVHVMVWSDVCPIVIHIIVIAAVAAAIFHCVNLAHTAHLGARLNRDWDGHLANDFHRLLHDFVDNAILRHRDVDDVNFRFVAWLAPLATNDAWGRADTCGWSTVHMSADRRMHNAGGCVAVSMEGHVRMSVRMRMRNMRMSKVTMVWGVMVISEMVRPMVTYNTQRSQTRRDCIVVT